MAEKNVEKTKEVEPGKLSEEKAKDFRLSPTVAANKYPELKKTVEVLKDIEKKIDQSPLSIDQKKAVSDIVRNKLAEAIEKGRVPERKQEKQQELSH